MGVVMILALIIAWWFGKIIYDSIYGDRVVVRNWLGKRFVCFFIPFCIIFGILGSMVG